MSGRGGGRKRGKGKPGGKTINVEIAPGIKRLMDAHIEGYNRAPNRVTPKLNRTDVVNEALDLFLAERLPALKRERGKEG